MTPLSHTSAVPPDACHLAKAIASIGDKWTLMILRSSLFGLRRFDDFQRELGAPRTVLSGRLKALVSDGLMEKQMYKVAGKRARPEYVLTPMGEALRPVLIGLTQWADAWLVPDKAPPLSFTHAKTRQQVKAGFVGANGHEVAPTDLRLALRK